MKCLFAMICLTVMASAVAADDSVDYQRDIKPVLQARCYACHGVLKQEAGLRLDTARLAVRGSDTAHVITPGDTAASSLLQRISSTDDAQRMPPEGEPLKPEQIAALTAWVAQGAIAPANELPERDPREHWAFQTPVRPMVPAFGWGINARDDVAELPPGEPGPARAGVPVQKAPPRVSRANNRKTDTSELERQQHSADAARINRDNPIDAFLAATHQQQGLRPQPEADRRIWLRRVSLDLTGLPPTPDELDAFLADDSPEAVDVVVTRLLDSPHYGERWGRHWMDIWRYSDWWGLGDDARNSQKHIWHWRDWIVESLNTDRGYDQMLREMLAADELYPEDSDRLRAGGFLARQYFKFNRTSWLDETIEHTAKAMLGLTFNCAKCHDHKYDPFSQADYYRFRAVFEPYQIRLDATAGQIDFEKDGIPRPFDCNLDAVTYIHIRGDDRNPDTSQSVQPGFPAFLTRVPIAIEPVSLPSAAVQPGIRTGILEAYLGHAEQQRIARSTELDVARKQLVDAERFEALSPDDKRAAALTEPGKVEAPPSVDQARLSVLLAEKNLAAAELQPASIRARGLADLARFRQPASTDVIELARAAVRSERIIAATLADAEIVRAELDVVRAAVDTKAELDVKLANAKMASGNARKLIDEPGESFTPLRGALKALESNLETEESRQKPFPATSTGRRTALAKWITDPQHPLTARVAVNHIWSRHFGRPLVPTVFDFGRKGTSPTHPELLDWLALELMEGDRESGKPRAWSMKHIHRLIVTSNAYRMTSTKAGASDEDLANDPDNRFYWRMNPIRMESQIVRDTLLALAGELDLTMGGPSIPISNEGSRRRSMYFVHSNVEHQKFLSMFDDASVLECYRRSESIVPQQALALQNSSLAMDVSEKIARRIGVRNPVASDREFIRSAFVTILSAEPTEAECEAVVDAMIQFKNAATRSNHKDPEEQAKAGVIHALLNHNDFVTVR